MSMHNARKFIRGTVLAGMIAGAALASTGVANAGDVRDFSPHPQPASVRHVGVEPDTNVGVRDAGEELQTGDDTFSGGAEADVIGGNSD